MTRPTTHTFCKDKKGRRCTIAIRESDVPNLFNVAVSRTSPQDNFSRSIGRRIAYGRLNKADNLREDDSNLIDNVFYYMNREDVLWYLTTDYDISEKRATLMIDKDLLRLPPPSKRVSQ